jgi:hypothetical protein
MPLPASRVLKQFRYAMYFDGVDDYVLIVNNPSLNPSQGTWIIWNLLRPSDGISRIVVAKYYRDPSSGLETGWDFYIDWRNIYMFFFRYPQYTYIYDASPPFYIFSFHALANDGSVSRLYRNGALIATASMKFPSPTPNNIYISTRKPGYNHGYHSIAQFLFYSRALSGPEIVWNYNNPDNPVRNGLVLWLKADPAYVKDIDNDGILEWLDLSGYNNHGKIYGAQLVNLIKDASRVVQAQRVLSCAR